MVKELYNLSFEWVRGHTGDSLNEEADLAADEGRKGHRTDNSRYRHTPESLVWMNLMEPNSILNENSSPPLPEGPLNECNDE